MNRNQFTFYKSFDDTFEALNDEQTVMLFKALRDVQFLRMNVESITFDDSMLNLVWASTKHSLKTSIKGYLDSQLSGKVKTPYLGCYKGYDGTQDPFSSPFFTPFYTPYEGGRQQVKGKGEDKEEVKEKEQVQVQVKEQEGENEIKKSNAAIAAPPSFIPPTLEQLDLEFQLRNIPIPKSTEEAEKFKDHYDSKGWVVGEASMVNWKAAVKGWARKIGKFDAPDAKKDDNMVSFADIRKQLEAKYQKK